MRKQKRIPYESCIIIYFFLQLIYVYAKGTCVSVSDEYTYKQIAMDIFQGEAVSSYCRKRSGKPLLFCILWIEQKMGCGPFQTSRYCV